MATLTLLDAIKARQNIRFVTFYQKKFGYSSKEAYYYGEKKVSSSHIFLLLLILSILKKILLFSPFL